MASHGTCRTPLGWGRRTRLPAASSHNTVHRHDVVAQALDTRSCADLHGQLQQRFGREDVIRPCELVASSMEGAVAAAVGSTLIVSNDELGSRIGREHGLRCVTIDGVVHEFGTLQGGHRAASKQPSFAAVLERQTARAAEARSTASLEELRSQSSLLQDAARSASSLAAAVADESEANVTIQQLHERLKAQRSELLSAVESLAEQTARAAGAATLAEGLGEDLAMLRGVQGPHAHGWAGRHDQILEALSKVARHSATRAEEADRNAEAEGGKAARYVDGSADAGPLDAEATALAEYYQEHLAAGERAASALCEAESDQARAEQFETQTRKQAALSSQMEVDARAAIRYASKESESAASAMREAEAEISSLNCVATIPDVATRWLPSAGETGEAFHGDDDDELEDDDGAEDAIAGLTVEDNCEGTAVSNDERVAMLSGRLHAGELVLATWRRERQELQRAHGRPHVLRALLATCGNTATGSGLDRLAELEELQRKAATVSASSARHTRTFELAWLFAACGDLALTVSLTPHARGLNLSHANSRAPYRGHRADEATRRTGQRRCGAQGARGHKGTFRATRTEPRARHRLHRPCGAWRQRCPLRDTLRGGGFMALGPFGAFWRAAHASEPRPPPLRLAAPSAPFPGALHGRGGCGARRVKRRPHSCGAQRGCQIIAGDRSQPPCRISTSGRPRGATRQRRRRAHSRCSCELTKPN